MGTLVTVLVCGGCGTTRKDQLHGLARDWFETIRSEQVIPVLPMTADIMPGDVFLVQTPIDRQQETWRRGDYLPLDNHIFRIDPTGYGRFYGTSFFDGPDGVTLPRDWMRPQEANSAWSQAPGAAFPTLNFQTTTAGGFNAVLPIHGVPVGMSLLGATRASGTIIISDARTVGVDMSSLLADVQEFANDPRIRAQLAPFGSPVGTRPQNYLRVVTRVYLAGRVAVTVNDARSFGGGLDVGSARPVDIVLPEMVPPAGGDARTPIERAADVKAGIDGINTMLAAERALDAAGGVLPGASLRVTSVSARTVSLDQTFDPPLVVGYLGFDVPIWEGGILDGWIPTHAHLEGAELPDPIGQVLPPDLATRFLLLNEIRARPDSLEVLRRAAASLGPDFESVHDQLQSPHNVHPADRFADLALAYESESVLDLRLRRLAVNEALERELRRPQVEPPQPPDQPELSERPDR